MIVFRVIANLEGARLRRFKHLCVLATNLSERLNEQASAALEAFDALPEEEAAQRMTGRLLSAAMSVLRDCGTHSHISRKIADAMVSLGNVCKMERRSWPLGTCYRTTTPKRKRPSTRSQTTLRTNPDRSVTTLALPRAVPLFIAARRRCRMVSLQGRAMRRAVANRSPIRRVLPSREQALWHRRMMYPHRRWKRSQPAALERQALGAWHRDHRD
jgi:hypothetical protein